MLTSVPSTELQAIKEKLDPKLLPKSGSKVYVDDKQVFKLIGQKGDSLAIVPVRFDIPTETTLGRSSISECGVYLLPINGTAKFLWTSGKDDEQEGLVQCAGVEAVGSYPVADSNPELILIFRAFTVHDDFSDPYVLSWNKGLQGYEIDEVWGARIAEGSKKVTIANIKQLMSQKK